MVCRDETSICGTRGCGSQHADQIVIDQQETSFALALTKSVSGIQEPLPRFSRAK